MMGGGFMAQIKQVVEELRTAGDSHITFLKLDQCKGKELGIASHPTAESYISRGDALIDLIEELTGWKEGEIPETTQPLETTEAPGNTDVQTLPPENVTEETPSVTEPVEEKKGCGSAVAPAAAILGAVAVAVVSKKKKED